MEIAMLAHEEFRGDTSAPPPDHSNIAVHSRCVGHSRAITSVFFNLLEDQLAGALHRPQAIFMHVYAMFMRVRPIEVAAFEGNAFEMLGGLGVSAAKGVHLHRQVGALLERGYGRDAEGRS